MISTISSPLPFQCPQCPSLDSFIKFRHPRGLTLQARLLLQSNSDCCHFYNFCTHKTEGNVMFGIEDPSRYILLCSLEIKQSTGLYSPRCQVNFHLTCLFTAKCFSNVCNFTFPRRTICLNIWWHCSSRSTPPGALAMLHIFASREYGRMVTAKERLTVGREKLVQKTIDFENLEAANLKEVKGRLHNECISALFD